MVPIITLNNGAKAPVIGLGTWKLEPNQVSQVVRSAIDIGYRHFDCASMYQNEKEVGQAIAEKIAERVIKREDLFITSKLWNTFHKPEAVENALQNTLKDLQLQYLDLYLIHWPMGYENSLSIMEPSDDDYIDTWKAMEEVYKKGLTKSIGVSNFNIQQIERLLTYSLITPVTNQVECHAYFKQQKLIDFCKLRNITVTAYGPLGFPYRSLEEHPKLIDHPKIIKIAKRLQRSSAQVLLRYQIQRGIIVIPKSVNTNRLIENLQIFDFELSVDDMDAIDNLGIENRFVKFLDSVHHKFYPFHDDY